MPGRRSRAVPSVSPYARTATIPACFMAGIPEMCSRLLPTLAAPIGSTRALAHALARSRMNGVTLALSFTGFVFGMQQTAVSPPRAAAFVAVSMVSEDSCPGSRRCAWRSMKPGATICPPASNTSKPLREEISPAGATSAIRSPSSKMSRVASVLRPGSTTRPFLTRSMRWILYVRGASIPRLRCFTGRLRVLLAVAGTQQEEQRHSHRNAVGYLVQHTRLRTVGDLWRNFNAAVHRPGMQHNRIPLGTAEPLAIQLIQQDVITRRECGLVQPFRLHPEHHNNVCAFQCFL